MSRPTDQLNSPGSDRSPRDSGGQVRCPWCGSGEVERVAEFGPQLLTHAYRCSRCRSPFEVIRRS